MAANGYPCRRPSLPRETPAWRCIRLIDLTHAHRLVSVGTVKPGGRIRGASVFNDYPVCAEVFFEPAKIFGAKVFPHLSGFHLFKPYLDEGRRRILDSA